MLVQRQRLIQRYRVGCISVEEVDWKPRDFVQDQRISTRFFIPRGSLMLQRPPSLFVPFTLHEFKFRQAACFFFLDNVCMARPEGTLTRNFFKISFFSYFFSSLFSSSRSFPPLPLNGYKPSNQMLPFSSSCPK